MRPLTEIGEAAARAALRTGRQAPAKAEPAELARLSRKPWAYDERRCRWHAGRLDGCAVFVSALVAEDGAVFVDLQRDGVSAAAFWLDPPPEMIAGQGNLFG